MTKAWTESSKKMLSTQSAQEYLLTSMLLRACVSTEAATISNHNSLLVSAPWPICHTNWLNRPACGVDDVALLASVGEACIFCDGVRIVRLEVSRKFAHSCGVHWLSIMVFCVHIHHAIWIVANGASMLGPHHLLEIANRKDCILVCISCTLGEADILIEARRRAQEGLQAPPRQARAPRRAPGARRRRAGRRP